MSNGRRTAYYGLLLCALSVLSVPFYVAANAPQLTREKRANEQLAWLTTTSSGETRVARAPTLPTFGLLRLVAVNPEQANGESK